MTLEPYYIVFDMPWLLNSDRTVSRTIDLCYQVNGNRLYPDSAPGQERFCEYGPAQRPAVDWDEPGAPYTGTRRAVNFKSSWMTNAGGPERWCTDAWGRATVLNTGPCGPGSIEQYAAAVDNHWNDGTICMGTGDKRVCSITGSIRAEDPRGNVTQATVDPTGGYFAPGPGFEFRIDQSDPDDNLDGTPDGAEISGLN